MPIPKASRALNHFTVLDLTRVRAGPDLRAPARRLGRQCHQDREPPDARRRRADRAVRATGCDFQNLHRNKRGITLEPEDARGAAPRSCSWSKKADVVVENFRPDVKRRLGIDYEDLKKVNPRIVYGSISGFGQDGPYAETAGLRPDRAGHGRADVDHRPAGAGPGARRHSDRRPDRRPVLRDRHPDRAARAREVRARASMSRPRCCRRRSSCSTSRPRAG